MAPARPQGMWTRAGPVGVVGLLVLAASVGPGLAATIDPAGPMTLLLEAARITPDDAHEPGPTGGPSHTFVFFGSKVVLDGDLLAVGTAYDDSSRPDNVYLFERGPDSSWLQTAKLEAGDALDQPRSGFGFGLALDAAAGRLVVGDPGFDLPEERDAGAVYVFERNGAGDWVQVAQFIGPDPAGDEHGPHFGWSVAIAGDLLVVGTPREWATDGSGVRRGAVYVYERTDGEWHLTDALGSDVPLRVKSMGYSVALAGATIVAGAPASDADTGERTGAVALFERGASGWGLAGLLQPPLGTPVGFLEASFGFDVDAAPGAIVVGDPGWGSANVPDDKISTLTGAAFVFERGPLAWDLAAQLVAPEPQPFMSFGDSVGITEDGTAIVVGADHFAEAATPPPGTAFVFERLPVGPWTLTRQLAASDTCQGDWFGETSSISGRTAVVGAPFDDNRRDGTPAPLDDHGSGNAIQTTDGKDAGSVYVFELGPR